MSKGLVHASAPARHTAYLAGRIGRIPQSGTHGKPFRSGLGAAESTRPVVYITENPRASARKFAARGEIITPGARKKKAVGAPTL